jgi:tRNA splicing ligase
LYCEILFKCYLSRFSYTESELLEILHLERSSFYDRKKEAILVFGISMWGTAIPKMRELHEGMEESMMIG